MINKASMKDSIVTITGGTGSFGSTMVKHLLAENVSEIRVFSRDENKQDLMRNTLKDKRIRYFIGDVRDFNSVMGAIKGADFVFHAAALKQVPSCEFFPMQAVQTNVSGSDNVIRASVENNIKSVVCLSTDKAVYPINAMGMSKAMMEKVAQSYARLEENSETRICITRYGNVMMSRGSVIPLFLHQIRSGQHITITNGDMTRFLMSLEDSVDLVKYAFTNGQSGDLFVKKAPACTVDTLVEALGIIEKCSERVKVETIGTRHGEKLYEVLVSSEELATAFDEGSYFRVPLDTRGLDYGLYFDQGDNSTKLGESFNSHNTTILSSEEVAKIIANLPEYAAIKG
jgi:UDP-N-acetylglucosamine 4,6-dehydratase/5-epimerase